MNQGSYIVMPSPVIVRRPPLDPPRLSRLASAAGAPAREFLIEAIARHATFEGAADELGVSLLTLRRWRSHYGIEVA